jgi:hypothetical protein
MESAMKGQPLQQSRGFDPMMHRKPGGLGFDRNGVAAAGPHQEGRVDHHPSGACLV